ncbi:MAG: lysophospholipid acyltransferase family protein [Acidobacteriia bacterium]|nr:lysophospholipid acyltransferase family protein [Terriglobia bacterium]
MSEQITETAEIKAAAAEQGAAKRDHQLHGSPRAWTRWQRFQIWAAAYVGYGLIELIGRTLRFESRGDENLEAIYRAGHRAIFAFWHNRIFGATWYYRRRGIVVMTSQNFDGEYIARFIKMHGYGTARGSSSRGGMRALAEMARCLKQGSDVGFTIDGPRGPLYQAKMGPVLLARKTGDAIFCFHVSYEKKWVLGGSWDHFQIPKPFSRALIINAPPIYIDPAADKAALRTKHQEMQHLLDRIREEGDSFWADSSRRNS